MNEIKVIKWIGDDEMGDLEDAGIGGMGGWFGFKEKGQRWKDYLDIFKEEAHAKLEALRASIIENNIRMTADVRQSQGGFSPVFSDNTTADWSWRGWGDLMAAVWSEHDDKDYSYMDFYM